MSIVAVFPSLNPKPEKVDPYAKLITPYYVTLLFEENFRMSGKLSVLIEDLTAPKMQECV